ncbi:MAG: SRPBCC family protein [Caldilineaceae bacterium]|nr:SRPBCC family protein [Caldilineaceae bacterium]
MAHEVLYETGKRKEKSTKGEKAKEAPDQPLENEEVGWEEQLWMNQASTTAEEVADNWESSDHVRANGLQSQWNQVRNQVEQGLQNWIKGDSLRDVAGASLHGLNERLNDDRSREEIKRWSSLVGGGLLALWGLRRSMGSLAVMGLGAGLIYYAFTGTWLLRINNSRPRRQTPHTGRTGSTSLDSNRPLAIKNIIVKAPLQTVYAAWADFENFPNFMQHIRSVTKTGEATSHWVMDGPLHSRLEWDAEVTRQEEDKRIAWSSTSGDIKTSGQVTFNALPDDQVEVTVMLRYIPPVGIAGDLFATLFADPEGKLAADLRNFKQYIEKQANQRKGAKAK